MLSAVMRDAFVSTILAVLSLALWRIAYVWTDWAIIAMVPFGIVIAYGTWSLIIEPWRANLHLVVRQESTLAGFLTGRIRAYFISVVFTVVVITALAWQALNASWPEALIMSCAFFLSACCSSIFENKFSKHFYQPFNRSMAASAASWGVSSIFFLFYAAWVWGLKRNPGELLEVETLQEVMAKAINVLPAREGWVTAVLSYLASYENLKLWLVVKLRDYPFLGVLYSFDAALFAYVLCRSAVVSAFLVKVKVFKD